MKRAAQSAKFSSFKNRQMKAGQKNKYEMSNTSDLTYLGLVRNHF